MSMPSAPTTFPKVIGFLTPGRVCHTKSLYSNKHVFVFTFKSHARRNGDSSLQARLVRGMWWLPH